MSEKRSACIDFLLILLAIFLPPIAVAFKRGICSADFLINVALSCLGFVPGLVHAIYIVVKYPRPGHCHDHHVAGDAESQPLLNN